MSAHKDEDGVLRVITHSIPWPDDSHERPSQELKWRVTIGDEELIAATKRPFEDASAILSRRGESDDALFTMRHAHLPYDSFRPMPLIIAAKAGLKRMEAGDKFRAYLAEKAAAEAAAQAQ